MSLLSIVIVSWNVEHLLAACLRSIDAHKGTLAVEVIVVDSASHDGTVAMVSAEFPHVTLLAQSENVGFPRGNNIGLAQANGDYLLLLNPDTEVVGDALQTMVNYLDNTPEAGMVGPELLNTDGSHQSSRRRFPTLLTGIFESTWLQPYAPKQILRDYYMEETGNDEVVSADWVNGACMMTRRDVYERVGGMDPGYFMYSEELDWCRRVIDAGYSVTYLPTAQVLHHQGKSSEQAVTHRHINFNRAKLRYFRKFHGRGAYTIIRTVLLLTYLHQIVIEGLKYVLGHRRDLRQQRIQSYLTVLQSKLSAAGY
ncbi:MAG: glycosyltransferase family 2 protein [Candidatus Promineifilaceae bacterium]